MARSKGPDLSSTAENPNFETHVGRVQQALGDATPTQRINGGRWYRGAYQDAKDVAVGVAPGVHIEHPDAEAAAHGITYPKPGSTGQGGGREELLRQRADSEWRQQQHASSVGQGHWRMVNAPHLVALVRAGATFTGGKLVDRPGDQTQAEAA